MRLPENKEMQLFDMSISSTQIKSIPQKDVTLFLLKLIYFRAYNLIYPSLPISLFYSWRISSF